jgi:hypothetical protein
MSSFEIDLSVGRFPIGYCWQGPQQYADDLIALMSATLPDGATGIIVSSSIPGPSDQDKAWLRLNNDGTPDKLYKFQGAWIALNPTPAGGQERRIWTGTNDAGGLWSYDGGDGSDPGTVAPTATTGSMWQVDTNFNFAIPMGVGTSPNTYDGNPATVLGLAGTLGEERHVLLNREIPKHTHQIGVDNVNQSGAANNVNQVHSEPGAPIAMTSEDGTVGGLRGESHQNLPPVVGVYFIKRTARTHYVAS